MCPRCLEGEHDTGYEGRDHDAYRCPGAVTADGVRCICAEAPHDGRLTPMNYRESDDPYELPGWLQEAVNAATLAVVLLLGLALTAVVYAIATGGLR